MRWSDDACTEFFKFAQKDYSKKSILPRSGLNDLPCLGSAILVVFEYSEVEMCDVVLTSQLDPRTCLPISSSPMLNVFGQHVIQRADLLRLQHNARTVLRALSSLASQQPVITHQSRITWLSR